MFRASWSTSIRLSLAPRRLASVSTTASTRLRPVTDPPLPTRPAPVWPTPASPASTRPVAASPVPVNPPVCPVCCITAPFPLVQLSVVSDQWLVSNPQNTDLFHVPDSLFFRSSHSGP